MSRRESLVPDPYTNHPYTDPYTDTDADPDDHTTAG
jgi:hypothetical protein